MIFNIEVKDGQIINIDGCTDTRELAAKWECNIPQQWPNKTIECHLALKMAILPNEQTPDNNYNQIVTGGYRYCISDNTKPATEEYLQEVGQMLKWVYNEWKRLVKVPNALPDGSYKIV